jgi:PEP-CTERM motif
MRKTILLAAASLLTTSAHAATLFSNGPVVNAQGLSIQTAPYATTGVGVQATFGNAVADDFVVGGDGWIVTDLDFFAYKDAFTFTGVVWSIVANNPLTGQAVASGTSAVTNGGLLGYRVLSNALNDTSRKIFGIKADIPDVTLMPGTYWLTWSLQATGVGPFGPWQQPVSGVPTGNAMQSGSFPWTAVIDPGAQVGLALPFQINGSVSVVPEPATAWLMFGGLAVAGGLAARRRAAG